MESIVPGYLGNSKSINFFNSMMPPAAMTALQLLTAQYILDGSIIPPSRPYFVCSLHSTLRENLLCNRFEFRWYAYTY